MHDSNKPRLSESQFYEEFFIACKGLKHKYRWNLTGVRSAEEDGVQMTVFETKEIGIPVAIPSHQFAFLVNHCFYTQNLTLCDELNKWLLHAREEVKKQH